MSYRALLLLAATPLFAQFSQLVATDDGSQIYFISPLTLASNTSRTAESGIYHIGPDGVFLVPEPPPVAFYDPLSPPRSIIDPVSDPQVSGDGTLFGFTYRNICSGYAAATGCDQIPAEAELRGSQTADLGPGVLQLSRNGRWALVTNQVAISTPLKGPAYTATLIDLTTRQHTDVPQPLFPGTSVLASDGTVMTGAGLWKQGQVTPMPSLPGFSFTPLALSDNAAIIVSTAYQMGVANSIRLVAFNMASGAAATLYQSTSSTLPVFMAMSNFGTRALYRVTPLASAAGTAYVADTSTGQSTAIALPGGESVIDGTISGAGDIAFLVTTLGRIVKVTLATGAVEPLIPPRHMSAIPYNSLSAPWCTCKPPYPGTAADWTGQILLGNQPLPVLGVKPGEVDVQVPWEQASGPAQFQIAIPTGSPFQQIQTVFVSPIAPAFELLPAGQSAIFPIDIIKGDWSGFQTTQPHAGDIVYIYMTGLGPVTGPVQTGVPASLTTPNPIQSTLTCTFLPQTAAAQTLFAGLAPGLIGIYQTAFRLPADPNTQPLNGMACDLNGSASFGFGIINAVVSVP